MWLGFSWLLLLTESLPNKIPAKCILILETEYLNATWTMILKAHALGTCYVQIW
jgi:hypothetical protein